MEKELIREQKAALRKSIKSELAAFCSDIKNKADAENKAASVFFESDEYRNASFIFCFISSENEISTLEIIRKGLKDKKIVVVPRVVSESKNSKMDFYYLNDEPLENQTETGAFGIIEPLTSLRKLNFNQIPKRAVMLMPGLGFGKNGARLGKGKGFYDIFIDCANKSSKSFFDSSVKIGLCFNIQLKDEIPCDRFDVKADFVITENGIVDCKLFT